MKNLFTVILIASLVIGVVWSPVQAEMVMIDEARTVAKNWVTLVIQKKGDWGGSKTADVGEIKEFTRRGRNLGYFCTVKPRGFIIISFDKQLAPVKAYSDTSDLIPESEVGLADLIKGGMERVINAIGRKIGPVESAREEDFTNILEINYRQAWDELGGNVDIFKDSLRSGLVELNYQQSQILLTSSWHQGYPYNIQCPGPPSGSACGALNCQVGCTALAGAQVMRYWAWPPGYDWPNMPDTLISSSPQVQKDAVARLCHEVGVEAGTDYCDDSSDSACQSSACFASCITKDLLDTFEDHFSYNTEADDRDRNDYSAVDWFEMIKGELNNNRPLPYAIPDHVIVADGWQEIGTLPTRQYHINYGWGASTGCNGPCNAWVTLDGIYGGNPGEEEMIIRVRPSAALGNWLSGNYYPPSLPYRYFDQDATGGDAYFHAGHNLQFLPGIKVTSSGWMEFRGWSDSNTRLFSIANGSKGIRIYSGHIYLYNGGSLKFPK